MAASPQASVSFEPGHVPFMIDRDPPDLPLGALTVPFVPVFLIRLGPRSSLQDCFLFPQLHSLFASFEFELSYGCHRNCYTADETGRI